VNTVKRYTIPYIDNALYKNVDLMTVQVQQQ